MRKYILIILLVSGSNLFAQGPEDALRYSFLPHNGSARYMSIGGVMGSLGGDITAPFVNPAGLGFYRTEELVLSPQFLSEKMKISFRENVTTNDNKNSFSIGTTGWIKGFTPRHNPKNSSAISIAINQLANFNNVYQYKGLNNLSSFSEQFAEEFARSGRSIDDVLNTNSILPYTAAPALYAYLIDTVTINGVTVVRGAPESILDAGQAIQQEMFKTTKGGMYELAFAYAQNTNDKWYAGITLGVPIISYKSTTILKESDTSAAINGFQSSTYTDNFRTTGAGVNLKLGVIYKPLEYIRLGLALHTPSVIYQTDTRSTSLTHNDDDTTINVHSNLFTNSERGENSYLQRTPWKAIISASYVFREVENTKRQKGFISADIEYVNHRSSRFNSDEKEGQETANEQEKQYYKQLKQVIKDQYKGAFNFRVGGELKFNVIMARLGFAYYMSPYKDKSLKANHMLLSGGLGYRDKGFFIDLGYVHNVSKDVSFPYRLEDRANTYASLKNTRGTFSATLGIKL
jgi:hypothetical protein